MQRAGQDNAIALEHLSFKGTLDTVRAFQARFRGRQRHHHKCRAIFEEMLETVADKTLDIRPAQQEPRAKKLRPKPYQLLTEHRSRFKEIPHRENYRKAA